MDPASAEMIDSSDDESEMEGEKKEGEDGKPEAAPQGERAPAAAKVAEAVESAPGSEDDEDSDNDDFVWIVAGDLAKEFEEDELER